jgi:hypothetical protein
MVNSSNPNYPNPHASTDPHIIEQHVHGQAAFITLRTASGVEHTSAFRAVYPT